jgi:hypothetical protein
MVQTVEYVLQSSGIHEHTSPVKRGKSCGVLWLQRRNLFEKAVLLSGNSPELFHHRIRKENLNLLHGSML